MLSSNACGASSMLIGCVTTTHFSSSAFFFPSSSSFDFFFFNFLSANSSSLVLMTISNMAGFKAVTQSCIESPSITRDSSFQRTKADGIVDRARAPITPSLKSGISFSKESSIANPKSTKRGVPLRKP